MIFHITAQHDHLSCWGVKARRDGNQAESQKEMSRWMEGHVYPGQFGVSR